MKYLVSLLIITLLTVAPLNAEEVKTTKFQRFKHILKEVILLPITIPKACYDDLRSAIYCDVRYGSNH